MEPHTRQKTQNAQTNEIDEKALEESLRKTLMGDVFFDNTYKALYSRDASNYRYVPIGVVRPLDKQDIINTVKICRQFHAPLLSRGGGTGLAGQTVNHALIMDMSKYYTNVLEVNQEKQTVRVQPGIILDDVRSRAAAYGLNFGPDPATHNHCTIGGMLGNNSCGVHSVMAAKYGNGARTSDNTDSLEVLTYDGLQMEVGPTSPEQLEHYIREGGRKGEIYQGLKIIADKYGELIRQRFPNIPRRVSGYNLPDLLPENGFNVAKALVGSEGTCVTILEASLNLIHNPKHRVMLVIGFETLYDVGYAVPKIMAYGPIALEGIDDHLVSYMKRLHLKEANLNLLPEGYDLMITGWGGDTVEEAKAQAMQVVQMLKQNRRVMGWKIYDKPFDQEKIWIIRESGLGATAMVPDLPPTWPGWEDSAVPPDKVGDYLRDLTHLFNKYGYEVSLYGHFGQGCVHCSIPFDLFTKEGLKKYRSFLNEASEAVLKYGGSLSGEHGDGQSRGRLLVKMFGEELMEAFREFKQLWDPDGKMNPGKIVDAYPITSSLRLGTGYAPVIPKTHFEFPRDNYSLVHASMRCVSVGECRRFHTGTMCPSYMVTAEEKHSTRGRASLLFEMLTGDLIKDGWKSEEVKDALDLCLACKGCKGDCPVTVDMATYKAEFLSHYYEHHPRPRHAYAFGFISKWARLASIDPKLANFVTHAPSLETIAKAIPGIAGQRKIPSFASYSFRDWFMERENPNPHGDKVILWPDTFNNYFFPEAAKAAVHVLEAAGFQVVIPRKKLCCGRPLYDYGFLDKAKAWLKDIMHSLQEEIRKGIPIVGLEPSCVSVFRDEVKNLFAKDLDAYRLWNQTYMLSEFIEKQPNRFHLPKMKGKAIVHGHCHHKAIMHMLDEKKVLDKLGLEYEILDSGCCGLAGSFGFEEEHYTISMEIGERVLLPCTQPCPKCP